MTLKTEGKAISDFLKYEISNYSREALLVGASQVITPGMVCGPGAGGRRIVLAAETNELQTIGITGTLTAGSFALGFVKDTGAFAWTDPIAYNANTAAIQTGVDTALGASKVVVGGTAITAMTFTFSGLGYAGKTQPLIQINVDGLTGEEDTTVTRTTPGGTGAVAAVNCVQTIANTGTAGSYILNFTDYKGDIVPVTVPWNAADIAAVNTLLDAALGTSQVVASGTVHTAMVITFSGPYYAARPQKIIVQDLTGYTYSAASVVMTTLGSPAMVGGADCVALQSVTTGAGELTTRANFLVRHAVVVQEELDFNLGNVFNASRALAARGIIVRTKAGLPTVVV